MNCMGCKTYENGFFFARVTVLLILFQLILVSSLSADPGQAHKRENDIRNSIVKIHTVASESNYFSPWKIYDPTNYTGSGCIIADKRILTNAL